MVQVSWTDAVAFCEWLSRRTSKDEDPHLVRLPTEAEWEYAARGEEGRKYPWGDAEPSERLANFGEIVGDTTPVASYPDGATPEGIHDLAGNVWEWCSDGFGSYPPEDEEDPTGPASGASRVFLGGAFSDIPESLRAAYRYHDLLDLRIHFIGFRVCRGLSRGL